MNSNGCKYRSYMSEGLGDYSAEAFKLRIDKAV